MNALKWNGKLNYDSIIAVSSIELDTVSYYWMEIEITCHSINLEWKIFVKFTQLNKVTHH